jgi:hypothetical protein
VIVCTENRLLIWNLLNLRLQTAVKLSVKDITIDSFTNAVGAFTIHNECKGKEINDFKAKLISSNVVYSVRFHA